MTMGIKKKANVSCDVCKLTFSSQVVLDTHLTGHKHQRKVKAIEMLETLKKTETCFELNSVTGDIRCNICDVTLHSPQHLTKHITGDKHTSEKGKRENGGQGGTPAKKQKSGSDASADQSPKVPKNPPPAPRVKIPPPPKKERPPLTITIPAYVTKIEDNKAGGKFLCNPCQSHCNSDIQLSQHLASKKHLDKVSGKKKSPPAAGRGTGRGWRGGPYGKGIRGGVNSSLLGAKKVGGSKWGDSSSSSSAYNNTSSNYNTQSSSSAFPETIFSSSNYSDSYGLSSLGRATATEYDYTGGYGTRSGGGATSERGWGGGRVEGGGSFARDEHTHSYSQQSQDVIDYGRGGAADQYVARADPYPTRTDPYQRAEYVTDYNSARQPDPNAYSRATTEYATHGYVPSQSVGHAPAGNIPYTYTPPLSQNFVGGGTIL